MVLSLEAGLSSLPCLYFQELRECVNLTRYTLSVLAAERVGSGLAAVLLHLPVLWSYKVGLDETDNGT